MEPIIKIQKELKAPKGQYNSFGKYHYRSCEDIIEALKPIIHGLGYYLLLFDEPVSIGDRVYIKATARLIGEKTYESCAYAREDENKKGMDGSQITGAASSYARKYALNGLLAIDDSKDADMQVKKEAKKAPLTTDMPEWKKAVEFVSKGGKIDTILKKYELKKEDEDELRKHTS